MSRRLDLVQLRAVLLDSIMEKHTVQELFDSVYGCIRLPAICFDVSFRLVAYAFPRPFVFPHWENMAATGHASDDTVMSNGYLGYQEMMYAKGEAQIFDWGTCLSFPQACGPVMLDGRLIAYCGIMLENAEAADVLEAANMVSKAISLIRKSDGKEAADSVLLGRSAELLLLHSSAPRDITETVAKKYPPQYMFAVMKTPGTEVSKLQYVLGVLCTEGGSAIGCLKGDNMLYVMYSGLDTGQDMRLMMFKLTGTALKYGLYVGVSDFFSDLSQIRTAREQALLAADCCGGDSGPVVYGFRENYSHIVGRCAAGYFGQEVCVPPEVTALAMEDKKNGTDYIITLEAWLAHFRRPAAAAEALHVHKNTVVNRLQRIAEIIGRDPDECVEMLTAGVGMLRRAETHSREGDVK